MAESSKNSTSNSGKHTGSKQSGGGKIIRQQAPRTPPSKGSPKKT